MLSAYFKLYLEFGYCAKYPISQSLSHIYIAHFYITNHTS